MSIYLRMQKYFIRMNSINKKYFDYVDKSIPDKEFEKMGLLKIVAENKITSKDNLLRYLNDKLNWYLSLYGNSPDESIVGTRPNDFETCMRMENKYKNMINIVQNLNLNLMIESL